MSLYKDEIRFSASMDDYLNKVIPLVEKKGCEIQNCRGLGDGFLVLEFYNEHYAANAARALKANGFECEQGTDEL